MKKYYGEVLGRKIVLLESDWKELRKRYDVKRVVAGGYDEWNINSECPLCSKYLIYNCRGCTFNKFVINGSSCEGCSNVIEVVLGTVDLPFRMNSSNLWWDTDEDVKAKKAVRKLYRELGRMELRG